jgi:hypothetical protein
MSELQALRTKLGEYQREHYQLADALCDMVNQFAYRVSPEKTLVPDTWLHDGGLSALECARGLLEDLGLAASHASRDWFRIKWDVLEEMKENIND